MGGVELGGRRDWRAACFHGEMEGSIEPTRNGIARACTAPTGVLIATGRFGDVMAA